MSNRLRVLFFGTTGPLSLASLDAIRADHQIVGVVCARPAAPSGVHARIVRAARAMTRRAPHRVAALAARCGATLWQIGARRELPPAETLCARQPDVVCVAGFPWKVPTPVLAHTPLGGVNLHTSLLPRHRGPLTLFWVYHANDREAGVTVHRMTDDYDAGDILRQHAFPLERGYPVEALNRRHALVGPPIFCDVLQALADGTARARPQDETLATYAPMVRPGQRMVDFASWDAERVWHFLAGLFPRFIEPLEDGTGRTISYRGVTGYAAGPCAVPPGRVTPHARGALALQCRDGVVYLRP